MISIRNFSHLLNPFYFILQIEPMFSRAFLIIFTGLSKMKVSAKLTLKIISFLKISWIIVRLRFRIIICVWIIIKVITKIFTKSSLIFSIILMLIIIISKISTSHFVSIRIETRLVRIVSFWILHCLLIMRKIASAVSPFIAFKSEMTWFHCEVIW